jgi:hypothetical protein
MSGKDLIPRPGKGTDAYQSSQSLTASVAAYPSIYQRYHAMDEPALMLADVVGRVNNTNLPKNKALLPLFEAIVNSLHAIEEHTGNGKGKIDIQIHRDHQQMHMHDEDEQIKVANLITGFSITDNGIGFNARHFDSFKTADSRLKENLGGKGIGRFLWLKAFDNVQISSVYSENGNYLARNFDFVLNEIPIQNYNEGAADFKRHKTEVQLAKIKKAYQDALPKKYTTIADKIIEHCLFYFLSDKCPLIVLHDEDEDSPLNLNERFDEKVKPYTDSESFNIKKHDFNIQYLTLYFGDTTSHRFHLCANQREVLDEQLYKYLPDLKSQRLVDEDKQEFAFVAYVSGDYLDKSVNTERTDFNFAKDSKDEIDVFDVSKKELSQEIVNCIKEHLKENLAEIEKEKFKQFEKFASEENPKYRPLLKYAEKELKTIPAGLSDEKLDLEMYKALSSYEARLKEEGCRFIGTEVEPAEDDLEFQQAYDTYIEKVTESGKARLAEYILHRKVILNLLEKSLQRQDDGKFSKEEKVHQILYPMRTTSEDNSFENQNLWIIDEKLAYHYYLASDLKFSQMKPLEVDSDKRPDILVFDKPTAFVEGEFPFYSVVVIELKKPEKKDYSEDKNPIQQVYDYIDILRSGTAEDRNNSVLRLDDRTRFYCYILANLTPQMVRFSKSYRFSVTPDNMGYYGYNDNYNAYVEVIDYKKLLEDSKKRNRVLFDKLGLPH